MDQQPIRDFVFSQGLRIRTGTGLGVQSLLVRSINVTALPQHIKRLGSRGSGDSCQKLVTSEENGEATRHQVLSVCCCRFFCCCCCGMGVQSKWEPKNKRMLMLHLTDGVQDVRAVEYQPVAQLHLDLIPGCKVIDQRRTRTQKKTNDKSSFVAVSTPTQKKMFTECGTVWCSSQVLEGYGADLEVGLESKATSNSFTSAVCGSRRASEMSPPRSTKKKKKTKSKSPPRDLLAAPASRLLRRLGTHFFFLIFKNVDIVRSTANIVVVNCVVGLSFIVLVCCYGNTDSILGRADEESATRSSLPSFRVAVDVLDPLDFLIWSETEFRLLSTRIPRSLISVRNEEPPFKRNTTKSCCNHEE